MANNEINFEEKVLEAYKSNTDMKDYIDKYMTKHKISLEQAVKTQMVQQYYKYLNKLDTDLYQVKR